MLPGDGNVMLATGCAWTDGPRMASKAATTATARSPMGSFPFVAALLTLRDKWRGLHGQATTAGAL